VAWRTPCKNPNDVWREREKAAIVAQMTIPIPSPPPIIRPPPIPVPPPPPAKTSWVHRVGQRLGVAMTYVLTCLALASCNVALYSSLPEQDINEMLAILLSNGIDAKKRPVKDNLYTLEVAERFIEPSIILLQNHGYPREVFSGVGDVFKQESRIASQLEQQARLNYALTQDLSHTLSEIDGVLSARVHVPITPHDGLTAGKDGVEGGHSAAAFIRYDDRYDLESLVPHIKGLLARGLHDVQYRNISVVLVPIAPAPIVVSKESTLLSGWFQGLFGEGDDSARHGEKAMSMALVALIIACVLVLSIGLNVMLWRRSRVASPQSEGS